MTISTSNKSTVLDNMAVFVKHYAWDKYSMDLLQLFGAFPHTRFSRLAIVHALNIHGARTYIDHAIHTLVDKGLVTISLSHNVELFSLTKDQEIRLHVLELAKLDWLQWQHLLTQITLMS